MSFSLRAILHLSDVLILVEFLNADFAICVWGSIVGLHVQEGSAIVGSLDDLFGKFVAEEVDGMLLLVDSDYASLVLSVVATELIFGLLKGSVECEIRIKVWPKRTHLPGGIHYF